MFALVSILSLNRLKNKLRYFEAGTSELSASCKKIQEDIEVEVTKYCWYILQVLRCNSFVES